MFADLHVHSQYSDGTLTISEIVAKAQAHNISLLSVCDHETADAYLYEKSAFANQGVTIITGAEINSCMDEINHHILAYGFDTGNKPLGRLLEHNRDALLQNGAALIAAMSKDYPTLSTNAFYRYNRNRKNGGWESIDYLRSMGIINNVTDFFRVVGKYGEKPTPQFPRAADVIQAIHEAGGVAVVAHLGETLGQDMQECARAATQFLDLGIDGFECYYTTHTTEITQQLLNFCRQHDLIITAGSDDHGGFCNDDQDVFDMSLLKIKTEQLHLKNLVRK
ncbi:MAG: PHP domain-containing protein [Defluviitaleaceae bacterium]|nr:PHP domain-containing protein [Defluviitaleaceae bacterium]